MKVLVWEHRASRVPSREPIFSEHNESSNEKRGKDIDANPKVGRFTLHEHPSHFP